VKLKLISLLAILSTVSMVADAAYQF